jgi:hypothetical protein
VAGGSWRRDRKVYGEGGREAQQREPSTKRLPALRTTQVRSIVNCLLLCKDCRRESKSRFVGVDRGGKNRNLEEKKPAWESRW